MGDKGGGNKSLEASKVKPHRRGWTAASAHFRSHSKGFPSTRKKKAWRGNFKSLKVWWLCCLPQLYRGKTRNCELVPREKSWGGHSGGSQAADNWECLLGFIPRLGGLEGDPVCGSQDTSKQRLSGGGGFPRANGNSNREHNAEPPVGRHWSPVNTGEQARAAARSVRSVRSARSVRESTAKVKQWEILCVAHFSLLYQNAWSHHWERRIYVSHLQFRGFFCFVLLQILFYFYWFCYLTLSWMCIMYFDYSSLTPSYLSHPSILSLPHPY